MRPDEIDFRNIESPVDVELMGIMETFNGNVEDIVNNLELMGIDSSDPVLLSGALRKLFKGIRKRMRERDVGIILRTKEGKVKVGKKGISFVKRVKPKEKAEIKKAILMPTGFPKLQDIFKNPLMLLIPAGLLLLLARKK